MQTLLSEVLLCWLLLRNSCMGQSFSEALRTMGQDSINNFKVQLQHSLEGARIRRKREAGLLTSVSDTGGFTADHLRVGSSAPGDLPYLSDYNLTMWTSIRHLERDHVLIGTQRGDLVLLDITQKDEMAETRAMKLNEPVGSKVEAFTSFDQQWFVVLQPSEERIQLYQREGQDLVRRQSINLDGEADFDVITVRGVHYLAVVTYRTETNQGYSNRGQLTLYHWIRTQFDAIAKKVVYGAKTVACWEMNNALYLAVSQEINDAGNIILGSPIFLFNAKDGESLVHLDNLRTKGPRKVVHFFVGGSHYLIFIGLEDAIIYWWSSNQFLSWQVIAGTAAASDVSVLALSNGEVILVIVLKGEIFFLTLDATGHYVVSFTMQFSDFYISSLQFMFDGRDYYSLVLFAAVARPLPHSIWKLTLDQYDLPNFTAVDPLIQCLSTLRDMTKERQSELTAVQIDLERVWVTNKEQVVTASVITHGSSTLQTSAVIDEITIHGTVMDLPRPAEVLGDVSSLLTTKGLIDGQMSGMLLKSEEQIIQGPKIFLSSISMPSLSLPNVAEDIVVNGLSFPQLAKDVLKKSGHQVLKNIVVSSAYAKNVITTSLNGLNLNDTVLLSGEYFITGKWQFFSLHANDAVTTSINNIPFMDAVTTNLDQDILEVKNFKKLTAEAIDVEGQTNSVDFSELQSKILSLDIEQNISSILEFGSPLSVKGSLYNSLINNEIALSTLDAETVKKQVPQEITGSKIFSSGVLVDGNIVVEGKINGIKLDQVATMHTRQNFTGNIHFSAPVTFGGNIWVNLLNGKDLSFAVLQNKDQHLGGLKQFTNSIVAGNLDMSETITLSGVDISHEAANIVKHEGGIVRSDLPSIFENVVILGSLKSSTGVNGYEVSQLANEVWLRHQPQVIEVPLFATTPVVIENDLIVSTVKNVNLRTDVLHVIGDGIISNEKTFQHNVHITRSSEIKEGKHLGGADIYSFAQEEYYEKLVDDHTIYGSKTMKALEIIGSITFESINNMNLMQDTMRPDSPQLVMGNMTIQLQPVIMQGNVGVNSAEVEVLNSFPFRAHATNAVMKRNLISTKLENKIFYDLKAQGMSLDGEGRVDGVNILEMLLKTVVLHTPQFITSSKEFVDPVHFSDQATALRVNGLDLVSLSNRVIYNDETTTVSGKKSFQRINSNTLNSNLLNDVDVLKLHRDAMSKTKDNIITELISFGDDINIDSLFINGMTLLDGMVVNNIALTSGNEFLNYGTAFLSSIGIDGNLFVSGLTNGCNLNTISRYALRTSSIESQMASGGIAMNRFKVYGNADIKKTLNNVSLHKLRDSLVGDSGYQIVIGNIHIHPGISATQIEIKGLLNTTDLEYLIKDAVLKTGDQEIKSYKALPHLEASVLTGSGHLFVIGTLNNVQIEELAGVAVRKSGLQQISGEKFFADLKAESVTLSSKINGLRLPNDVVLAAVDEIISDPVTIKKDLEIHSDLTVYGKIDGIDVEQLIREQITLNRSEAITSDVTFLESIATNELDVDEMINDIVMELVVQIRENNVIHGYKNFNNMLYINGDLRAPFVNGFEISKLYSATLSYLKDSTLHNWQTFAQSIYAKNSLAVEWINGFYLPFVTRTFVDKSGGLREILDFFTDIGAAHENQIGNQLSAIPFQASNFAYFVLKQEININGATRILTGNSKSSKSFFLQHSMIVWATQVHCLYKEVCCSVDYSYWLSVSEDKTLVISSGPQSGRFFPVQVQTSPNENLIVWTNSTLPQPEWCHHGREDTVIGSLSEGYLQTYLQVKDSATLMDVASFKDGFLYLVAGYYYDKRNDVHSEAVVYRGDEQQNVWEEYQFLPAFGILSLDLVTYVRGSSSEVLLAVGSGLGVYPDSYSSVYRWNSTTRIFVLLQDIPSQYVTSTHWISSGSQLLLAIAGVDNLLSNASECSGVTEGGQIDIYLYNGHNLKWVQSIRLQGVVSMVSFILEGETYLAAVSAQMQTVYVLQWQGYSGFTVIQTIHSKDVRHVNVFWIREELYMTFASGAGSSKILKAVVRGQELNILDIRNKRTNDQQVSDQPSRDQETVSDC